LGVWGGDLGLEMGVGVWSWVLWVEGWENLTLVCLFSLLFHLCPCYQCHFYLKSPGAILAMEIEPSLCSIVTLYYIDLANLNLLLNSRKSMKFLRFKSLK